MISFKASLNYAYQFCTFSISVSYISVSNFYRTKNSIEMETKHDSCKHSSNVLPRIIQIKTLVEYI